MSSSIFSDLSIGYHLILIARLVIACILGGIIGYERESTNRPAGFRTHILVCVGAALVMITSEFIFKQYQGWANIDPARLGAQVISGIGFLGAGTIIREGVNVRGLTTAASLWAVSCVGLAVGIGFYEGAIAATLFIYITLIVLKRMEDHFSKRQEYRVLYIQAIEKQGQIFNITKVFHNLDVSIKKIEISSEGEDSIVIKVLVKLSHGLKIENILADIHEIEGIIKITEG